MGENGQYFTEDSKVHVGQDRRFRQSSLGCDDIWVAIDWVTYRFFRKPLKGLMYSQATVTTRNIE